jgi:hypothetical protein
MVPAPNPEESYGLLNSQAGTWRPPSELGREDESTEFEASRPSPAYRVRLTKLEKKKGIQGSWIVSTLCPAETVLRCVQHLRTILFPEDCPLLGGTR